ncbi:putative splicing factor, arginine/serine-rich 7 [Trichinella nativa]|uniref:glutathione transferase n=1 Tax=Trichinella nativa TaxID=6335 RepID=A0A0V1L7T3_9BILA|nr:putative splicing factor, arginine/serine-rich 7 [Trichinella nativa]
MAPLYKLSYFDVRGLSEPIRLLFHDQKIEFIDHRFDRNEWPKIKPTIGMFGQVPCLYENGNPIVQSGAIMRHLGRRFDLYGNADEMTYVDEIYEGICDLKRKYAPFIYTEHSEEEVEKFTKEVLLVELQKFENLLKGKKYILNDKISFADYSLFDMLDTLLMLSPACLSNTIERAKELRMSTDAVDSTPEVPLALTFSQHTCLSNSLKVAILAKMPLYKLVYFDIRGLAEPIRLLLHDQRVQFLDNRIQQKDWPEMKSQMLFGQVPCLYEDDQPIVQSGAIMRHLGRRFGLYGNAEEMTYVDQIYEGVVDLRLKYARLIYSDSFHDSKGKFVNEVLPDELAKFEKILTRKKYILDDEITFADYALAELLDVLLILSSTCLENFTALTIYHSRFMNRPNLKNYLSSDIQNERRWNEKVHLVQISSISPLLTREQIYHMFSYFGRIEEFRMYPTDTNQTNFIGQTKLCYIRYVRSSSADTAQHMTNTVFIDRALICVPVPEGKIPEEDMALMLGGPTLPGQRQLPLGVVSETRHVDGRDLIVTIDPKLTQLGLPAYPPLSGSLPMSTVEEVRRTVFISGLAADVDKYDLMMFLNDNIGEVMYLRMAGRRDAAQRCAYVEFSSQLSVVNALQKNGLLYKGQRLRMWHSNTSIAKPLAKTLDMAKKEVEEAVRQSGILATAAPFNEDEVDRLIQRANSPLYHRGSRRHSRRRSRSRRRYSRSRDRSPRTPPRRYFIRSSTPPHLRLRRRSRRRDRRRRRSSTSSGSSYHRSRPEKSTARKNDSRERKSPKKDPLASSSSSFKRSRGSRSPAETSSKELKKRTEMELKFIENEADLVNLQPNEEKGKEKKHDKNDSPKRSNSDSKEKKAELSTLTPEILSKKKFISGLDELSVKGSNSDSMKANTTDEQEEPPPENKRHRSEYDCAEVTELSKSQNEGQNFSSPMVRLKNETVKIDGGATMVTAAEAASVELEEKKKSQNDERSAMDEDESLELDLSGGRSKVQIDKQRSKESSSKKHHRSSEKKNRTVELSKSFRKGSSSSSRRKPRKKNDRSPTPDRKEDRHRRTKYQQDAVELSKRSRKVESSGQDRKEKYSKRSKRKSKRTSSRHGRSTRRVRSSSSSSSSTTTSSTDSRS